MSQMLHFAVKVLGVDFENALWNVPMSQLGLVMNEEVHVNEPDSMTLIDKELVDDGTIDRELRKRRGY